MQIDPRLMGDIPHLLLQIWLGVAGHDKGYDGEMDLLKLLVLSKRFEFDRMIH